MKRGDTVFLIRPKRCLRVRVVECYDHFPAVCIRQRGEERIVAADELNEQDVYSHARAKAREEREREKAEYQLQNFLDTWRRTDWKKRMETKWTWQDLGQWLGLPAGAAWHQHRRAKKWGLL